MFGAFFGTWAPTERSKRAERILRLALSRIGLSFKAAAQIQGLDESQFSRQVAGRTGATPSWYRLADLPDDYHRERLQLEAPHYGLICLRVDQADRCPMLLVRMAERDREER